MTKTILENSKQCFAVMLYDSPVLAFPPFSETGNLQVDQRLFMDQMRGGFMGFHDWLRTEGDQASIIGLRFSPHNPSLLCGRNLERLNYVVVGQGDSCLEVFLTPNRKFDPSKSADQSFRLNRLLISSDQHVALVVDCDSLSEEEKKHVAAGVTEGSACWKH